MCGQDFLKIVKMETAMKAFRSFIGPATRWFLTVALISIFVPAAFAQAPTSTATGARTGHWDSNDHIRSIGEGPPPDRV